jgi:hypothetical protein
VGGGYTATRGTDPKIAQVIWVGLGDAHSVLNVGAEAGHPSHLIGPGGEQPAVTGAPAAITHRQYTITDRSPLVVDR